MLGNTSGLENSSVKWEGHLKWEESARVGYGLWERRQHKEPTSVTFGIYLGGEGGREGASSGGRGIFCA